MITRKTIFLSIGIAVFLVVATLVGVWIKGSVKNIESIQPDPITQTDQTKLSEPGTLYLTLMTHMELGFNEDEDEALFLQHVKFIRNGMNMADAVNAKLTIETEKPFARANNIWGINIMKEIVERGHGIQTHCDLGPRYTQVELSDRAFSKAFKENKKLVDQLAGAHNNLGCSGGAGVNNWLVAASMAGFKYINGIVGGHLAAMDYEDRPDPKWTDEYALGEGWHKNVPEDIYERIYPIPLADLKDLEADDNPIAIVLPGGIGRLDTAYEEYILQDVSCGNKCDLEINDVDTMRSIIRDVATSYDPDRGVAKMTVYLPVHLYNEPNSEVIKEFFSMLKELEQEGLFVFGTHKEVYEDYIGK